MKNFTKREFIDIVNEMTLYLNKKLNHNLKIIQDYGCEAGDESFESDLFCDKCNQIFYLDISINYKYYYNTFNLEKALISYSLSHDTFDDKFVELTCDNIIIKGIIE